jgi:hypothetical protein
VTRNVTMRMIVEIVLLFLVWVESDCSRTTPRYTMINCLGMERIVARLNMKMFIPQVENTAVVTMEAL